MAHYTALHQIDQESGKTESDIPEIPDSSRPFARFKWFGSGFCAAFATVLVFTIFYNAFGTRRNHPVPSIDVEFRPHPEFSNLTDPDSTRLWQDMLHHGHIFVEDATRFSLKPGIPVSAHGERLIVSGLHGLHCLRSLRNELTMAMFGHPVMTDTKHHVHNHPGRPDHCFDYIRQVLMCNLDLTYESARVDIDGKRRVADGWGAVHQCKDWTAINEWMLDNIEWEMSKEDWKEPDSQAPEGQVDLYGDLYPLYNKPAPGCKAN